MLQKYRGESEKYDLEKLGNARNLSLWDQIDDKRGEEDWKKGRHCQ